MADENVLGYIQVREHHRLLVDGGYPQSLGFLGIADRTGLSSNRMSPWSAGGAVIMLIGVDFGAVLADDHRLSQEKAERNVFQRLVASNRKCVSSPTQDAQLRQSPLIHLIWMVLQ
jgi:hypothetical protein